MVMLAGPCPVGGAGGTGDPHPRPVPIPIPIPIPSRPRSRVASRPLLPSPGRGERSGRRAPGRVFPNSAPSGGLVPLLSCVFSSTPNEGIEEAPLSLSPLLLVLTSTLLPAGESPCAQLHSQPYKSHLSEKCFPVEVQLLLL